MNSRNRDGATPLHEVGKGRHPLLDAASHPPTRSARAPPLPRQAATNSHMAVVKLLLRMGADPCAVATSGPMRGRSPAEVAHAGPVREVLRAAVRSMRDGGGDASDSEAGPSPSPRSSSPGGSGKGASMSASSSTSPPPPPALLQASLAVPPSSAFASRSGGASRALAPSFTLSDAREVARRLHPRSAADCPFRFLWPRPRRFEWLDEGT